MQPPEPVWIPAGTTMLDRSPPRVSVGGVEMYVQHRSEAQALQDAIYLWRKDMAAELGGTPYPASYVASQIRDVKRRLDKAVKNLERDLT
jgi:hypothetical protein